MSLLKIGFRSFLVSAVITIIIIPFITTCDLGGQELLLCIPLGLGVGLIFYFPVLFIYSFLIFLVFNKKISINIFIVLFTLLSILVMFYIYLIGKT